MSIGDARRPPLLRYYWVLLVKCGSAAASRHDCQPLRSRTEFAGVVSWGGVRVRVARGTEGEIRKLMDWRQPVEVMYDGLPVSADVSVGFWASSRSLLLGVLYFMCLLCEQPRQQLNQEHGTTGTKHLAVIPPLSAAVRGERVRERPAFSAFLPPPYPPFTGECVGGWPVLVLPSSPSRCGRASGILVGLFSCIRFSCV